MADVALAGVRKRFGETEVLRGIDLAIRDGEFMTLIGASGCGKSTLLRIIAGLEAQTEGTVAIAGRTVDHLRPRQRRIAMVFQSYALYPHMTVAQNMATPLLMDRTLLPERLPLLRWLSPRRAAVERSIREDVARVAEQLRIEALLSRRPAQLSGGQRQRVALGRAMVRDPDVFLMDEPLSNLDATLRVHMRNELAELHQRIGATFVYVTHDQVEAMTMSNRVALMEAGALLQVGTPHELYHRPRTIAVARFLGSPRINVFSGAVSAGTVTVAGVPIARSRAADGPALVGLRPEALALARPGGEGVLPARLKAVEDLGHEAIVLATCDAADDAEGQVRVRLTGEAYAAARAEGLLTDAIGLAPLAGMHLFSADGARLEIVAPEAGREAPRLALAGRPA